MIIRPVSSLDEKTGDLNSDDLFVVSTKKEDKYASQKLSAKTLFEQVKNESLENVRAAHDIDEGVSVKTIVSDVTSLKSQDMTITGTKTFSSIPVVAGDATAATQVANLRTVKNYASVASLIKQGSYIMCDPQNDTGPTSKNAYDSQYMLKWHIGDGQRDSTAKLDNVTTSQSPVTCKQSGNLVMYGWLADSGNVKPEEAWVGLYGQINTTNAAGTRLQNRWVLLQLQPWIQGTKHQQMQYVGFNVPVKAGLKLKVVTGFPVRAWTGTATSSNTLEVVAAGVIPNTFVGYIVTNGDIS